MIPFLLAIPSYHFKPVIKHSRITMQKKAITIRKPHYRPQICKLESTRSQQKERACILNVLLFNIQALFRFCDYSNSSTINLLSLYFIDTSSNFKLFFRSIIVFFSFFLCNGVKTGSQSRSWPAFAQSRQSALLYFQGSALPMKNAFRECQKCFGKSDFVLRSLPILLDIFVREKEHESHSLNQQLTQQERKPHAVQTKSDRKDQNKRRNYNARFQY